MRDDVNKLVAEFCLLNTDLGFDMFESGRMTAFMRAHTFFILHDEDKKKQTKKVLMGNSDDRNEIVTNDKFYYNKPVELRSKLMVGDSNEMDPEQLKIKFSLEMPSPKLTRGEMLVNIDLKEVKFFLRMQVFNDLSKFTITGLDRLTKQH